MPVRQYWRTYSAHWRSIDEPSAHWRMINEFTNYWRIPDTCSSILTNLARIGEPLTNLAPIDERLTNWRGSLVFRLFKLRWMPNSKMRKLPESRERREFCLLCFAWLMLTAILSIWLLDSWFYRWQTARAIWTNKRRSTASALNIGFFMLFHAFLQSQDPRVFFVVPTWADSYLHFVFLRIHLLARQWWKRWFLYSGQRAKWWPRKSSWL